MRENRNYSEQCITKAKYLIIIGLIG